MLHKNICDPASFKIKFLETLSASDVFGFQVREDLILNVMTVCYGLKLL